MSSSDVERIMAFEDRFAKAQASEVVDLPFGFAVLQKDYPHSHYHNRIAVTAPASAAEIIATAENILGGAGLAHRYVSVVDRLDDDVNAELKAAGFEHETIATMVYAGPEVELLSDQVEAVSLDALRSTIIRDWRVAIPDATDEVLRQLADRTVLCEQGAELSLLAVRDGGEIAAHADLYVDRLDRVAQFESLVTHADFRGRGHGGAVHPNARWRGHRAGGELFLHTADIGDRPQGWDQPRGVIDVAQNQHIGRRRQHDVAPPQLRARRDRAAATGVLAWTTRPVVRPLRVR
jgi:hypothetical protein